MHRSSESVAALASASLAQSNDQIPNLTSADFGWQSNVADWQQPPPGHGHGPIKPDPAHPFTSNAEAARTGTQPTKRIGNAKDPVLKPWAAALMQAYLALPANPLGLHTFVADFEAKAKNLTRALTDGRLRAIQGVARAK